MSGNSDEAVGNMGSTSDEAVQRLSASLRGNFEKLLPLSEKCCIYRFARYVRMPDPKIHTPLVVSIGPYGHGKPEYSPMEDRKRRFLSSLLRRTGQSLEDWVGAVAEQEAALRDCYSGTTSMSSDEFVTMVAVDAGFIIELILKIVIQTKMGRIPADGVLRKPNIWSSVAHDIMLLENQLPFFIINRLFNLILPKLRLPGNIPFPPWIDLAATVCLLTWNSSWGGGSGRFNQTAPKHLLGLLRACLVPSEMEEVTDPFERLEIRKFVPSGSETEEVTDPTERLEIQKGLTATELHHAGVKIQAIRNANFCQVEFDKAHGVLKVPRLKLTELTETLVRNVIMYEMLDRKPNYMSGYFLFINCLINTTKDVELLVKEDIVNTLWEPERVLGFVHNIVLDSAGVDPFNLCFVRVLDGLSDYCRKPSRRSKAILVQNYFNAPWGALSVLAVFMALLLTFIQTTCYIKKCSPAGANLPV